MYALQSQGLLGNFLRTWTWDDFLASNVHGGFGVRHRSVSGWPYFRRGFDRAGMVGHVRKLIADRKISPGDVVISEDTTLVDDARTLQGEVSRTEPPFPVDGFERHGESDLGLMLTFSGVIGNTLTCREEVRVLPRPRTVNGLWAKLLLQQFLDAPSYDFMQELVDRYPNAVVEFTSFSKPVGEFSWNSVFWEVRNY